MAMLKPIWLGSCSASLHSSNDASRSSAIASCGSRHRIHWLRVFCAYAPLLTPGTALITFAPCSFATFTVSSREPWSTTITSSHGRSESRARPSERALSHVWIKALILVFAIECFCLQDLAVHRLDAKFPSSGSGNLSFALNLHVDCTYQAFDGASQLVSSAVWRAATIKM